MLTAASCPRAQLIVNPVSGRGHGAAVVPAIEAGLRRAGYTVSTVFTPGRGQARQIVAETTRQTSLIVVVGGDGTLNEVVNGNPKAPLVVFPTGTANAFAVDQGLEGSVEFLEALVRHGAVEWLDLGNASGRRFVNMASCGILGQIHRAIGKGRDGTQARFRLASRAFGVLWRRRFQPLTLSCDGTAVAGHGHLLVISNTRTYAPGIVFTPDASPRDGLLDAVILPAPGIRDYLPWLRAVRRASRLCDPRVRYLRAHSIRVHESGIDWEVDGEYVGVSPLRVSVLPRSLAVVLPGSQERATAGAGRRGGVLS